jgi:predicted secreted hydrolase
MTAELESRPGDLWGPASVRQTLASVAPNLTDADAAAAATILALLGPAVDHGVDPYPTGQPLQFPADHLLHLQYGNEWYWFSANLTSDNGISVNIIIMFFRDRLVGQAIQGNAGWTDEQSQVAHTIATAGFKDGDLPGFHVVRNANAQWVHGNAGAVTFPSADNGYLYQIGPDQMQWGSANVLPVTLTVGDTANLEINLTFSSAMPETSAWFLQGDNGVTPAAMPGLYYSWPQLSVSGTVTTENGTLNVTGTGWIDHQLQMHELPGDPPGPLPPHPDPWVSNAFTGWQWCQFNFDNGAAYTGATFQNGPFCVNLASPYGFYVAPAADGQSWTTYLVTGPWTLDALIAVLQDVLQPTAWTMQGAGQGVDLSIACSPIVPDGSFLLADQLVYSEVPVTVSVNASALPGSTGPQFLSGAGYCETVGSEVNSRFVARALDFLAPIAARGPAS